MSQVKIHRALYYVLIMYSTAYLIEMKNFQLHCIEVDLKEKYLFILLLGDEVKVNDVELPWQMRHMRHMKWKWHQVWL